MDEKKKKSAFIGFLKKRAPIYLAVTAIMIVFVVPELIKGDLEGSFPELNADKQLALDVVMGYNGPDKSGLTLMEAISDKISQQYPNEKIFDNKKTTVNLEIADIDDDSYNIVLNFKSYKGEINYDWDVNVNDGKIIPNNSAAEHIIEYVNFYD